jgi:hypothetical protein
MKSSPVGLIGVGGSTVQVDDPIGEIPIKANTVEGFFGITKRGLIGTIQHIDRSLVALKGIAGKRSIHSHSPRQANTLRL